MWKIVRYDFDENVALLIDFVCILVRNQKKIDSDSMQSKNSN